MRIVIITAEGPAPSKHLCAYLGRRHDLVRVIHPTVAGRSAGTMLRRVRREVARSGFTHGLLWALSEAPGALSGRHWARVVRESEEQFFPAAAAEYAEVAAPVAARVPDVNGEATIRLVREAAADAVICLGGPIYRPPLINACKRMINFHSGVSPFYNGASAIMFAFANGHVRLCGGTLMTMSPIVDGGDILAHYLPAIEAGDTPATLFLKTARGAAETADRFLVHLGRTGMFAKCPQPAAIFYYTSGDWTIHHACQIRRYLKRGEAARARRTEEIVEYYAARSDTEASTGVRETIDRLLGLA